MSTPPPLTIAPLTIADVRACVRIYYRLSEDELLSASRARKIAWPRQTGMALSRELTRHSLPAIGKHFGRRDHTTVLYAVRAVRARARGDEAFAGELAKLRAVLNRLAWQRAKTEAERRLRDLPEA